MKTKIKLSKWMNGKSLGEGVKDFILSLVKNPEEVEVERRFFTSGEEVKVHGEELKEGERAIIQYVSTRDMDRDNEILLPEGCILSEFKKAPSVLWGHNYSLPPIGKDIWIKKDDVGIIAKTEYADTVRGEEAWQLRKGGFLKTSSVGFVPVEYTTPNEANWEKVCSKLMSKWPEFAKVKEKVRRIFTKWLLLEHSDVSVPANINALTLAVAKGEIDLSDEIRAELKVPGDEYLKALVNIATKAKKAVEDLDEENDSDDLTEEQIKKVKAAAKQNAIDEAAKEAIEAEHKDGDEWSQYKTVEDSHIGCIKSPGDFQPGSFKSIGRTHNDKEYSAIIGRLKDSSEFAVQSCIYNSKAWPVDMARQHCVDNKGILFEPAKKSNVPVQFIIRPIPKQETPEQRASEIKEAVTDEINRLKGRV